MPLLCRERVSLCADNQPHGNVNLLQLAHERSGSQLHRIQNCSKFSGADEADGLCKSLSNLGPACSALSGNQDVRHGGAGHFIPSKRSERTKQRKCFAPLIWADSDGEGIQGDHSEHSPGFSHGGGKGGVASPEGPDQDGLFE